MRQIFEIFQDHFTVNWSWPSNSNKVWWFWLLILYQKCLRILFDFNFTLADFFGFMGFMNILNAMLISNCYRLFYQSITIYIVNYIMKLLTYKKLSCTFKTRNLRNMIKASKWRKKILSLTNKNNSIHRSGDTKIQQLSSIVLTLKFRYYKYPVWPINECIVGVLVTILLTL